MNYAIIAAGEGSRLAQEGVKLPKPLVKLNGVALIDRLIDIFEKNNASSITVIVNEEMLQVQEYLKNKKLRVPFNLVVKSTPSSMHSFFELSKFLEGERFCLTTVDTIFKEDEFAKYIAYCEQAGSEEGVMAVTDYIDDEKPLYIKTDNQNQIENFLDQNDGTCKYISGGIYCLTPKAIDVLKDAMDNNIHRMRNYQRLLAEKGLKLTAFPFAKIVDVDHAEDIEKAEAFLRS